MAVEQEKKKMKETLEEIDEKFCAMPYVAALFKKFERSIRYYNRYRWNEKTTKERLIKKRDELLGLLERMDNIDLTILFYLRRLDGLG